MSGLTSGALTTVTASEKWTFGLCSGCDAVVAGAVAAAGFTAVFAFCTFAPAVSGSAASLPDASARDASAGDASDAAAGDDSPGDASDASARDVLTTGGVGSPGCVASGASCVLSCLHDGRPLVSLKAAALA